MATSIETMKSFMNVLKQYANDTTTSGITILDNAVRAVSRFDGLQDAINSFVNDVTDTSRIPDTAQRLEETCGIVLGADHDFNADTGAASGANAGNGEECGEHCAGDRHPDRAFHAGGGIYYDAQLHDFRWADVLFQYPVAHQFCSGSGSEVANL